MKNLYCIIAYEKLRKLKGMINRQLDVEKLYHLGSSSSFKSMKQLNSWLNPFYHCYQVYFLPLTNKDIITKATIIIKPTIQSPDEGKANQARESFARPVLPIPGALSPARIQNIE